MARYIDADRLVEKYERAIADNWNKKTSPSSWADAYDCIIADIDDQPTADVVSRKALEQVKWERDTAIEQLWTYGIALCEKKELKEVKHGEWIEDGYNDIPCVCSRCGSEAPYKADCREDYDYDYDDNLIFLGAEIEKEYIKTPYCPNCGADMRGDK